MFSENRDNPNDGLIVRPLLRKIPRFRVLSALTVVIAGAGRGSAREGLLPAAPVGQKLRSVPPGKRLLLKTFLETTAVIQLYWRQTEMW